jgi:hypothetical protein
VTQTTFDLLKHVFTIVPLLHPNPNKPFNVETDASDFVIGAILSQLDDVNVLHLVAYYLCKFIALKINYPTYNKELLTIITAFEEWRSYLGKQHNIQQVIDHKNLIYFSNTRTLNRKQARWSTFLANYNFEIMFRPGTQHTKANVLSCRSKFKFTLEDKTYV